jgi:hypothetical protein
LAKRKLELLAMRELELRGLARHALDGPPDNEDLLNPTPGTDMQLALAELGRRWQRWYLFKMLMQRPAPTLRMTADEVARSQLEVAGADATGADATGVLSAIHYVEHYVGRGARRQWWGNIQRPLDAHLQAHGLAYTASQVPLARFFGLEHRDPEQEEAYEVQPEVADMVWRDLEETPSERERHLARAREWVAETSALSQRCQPTAEPRAPSASQKRRPDEGRPDDGRPDDCTEACSLSHVAKRPRLSSLSNSPLDRPWSNDKPVFTVTDVCLSSTGAVSAGSSRAGLPTYAAGAACSAGRPTYDPKYGPITYLTPEQITQCVGNLMAKYWPEPPAPQAPTQALSAPRNPLESVASAVVALMVGSDAARSARRAPCMLTRAARRRRDEEEKDQRAQERAQKRQRTRDQRREKTDPYYRSYSVATGLPFEKKPCSELELLYVSSSTEQSEQASEQAATREERFVSIVLALSIVAAEHGLPGLSVHDAYLTKDPATLRITLDQLIDVSFPQHLRDHARLTVPHFIRWSGPCAARQILKTPLRELCGMTTKPPHFNFIRRGARRDDASTADVLRKFTDSMPQLTRDICKAVLGH